MIDFLSQNHAYFVFATSIITNILASLFIVSRKSSFRMGDFQHKKLMVAMIMFLNIFAIICSGIEIFSLYYVGSEHIFVVMYEILTQSFFFYYVLDGIRRFKCNDLKGIMEWKQKS